MFLSCLIAKSKLVFIAICQICMCQCISAAMPVSMSPGGTTPIIDGNNTTFFAAEQTTADTQLTQTLPGILLLFLSNQIFHVIDAFH